jgi:hypothetical protein
MYFGYFCGSVSARARALLGLITIERRLRHKRGDRLARGEWRGDREGWEARVGGKGGRQDFNYAESRERRETPSSPSV